MQLFLPHGVKMPILSFGQIVAGIRALIGRYSWKCGLPDSACSHFHGAALSVDKDGYRKAHEYEKRSSVDLSQ